MNNYLTAYNVLSKLQSTIEQFRFLYTYHIYSY